MKNKKGQFYLMAAIIIIMAISGIASIKTYAAVKSEPRKIQDISFELKEEGMRIIDYGVYKQEDLEPLLDSFTEEYAPYFLKKTDNTSIIFIYGDKNNLNAIKYKQEYTGVVYATLGGGAPQWQNLNTYSEKVSIIPQGDSVSVMILDKEFEFKLRENEMFYFIIVQGKDGEIYVEKNN